MTDRIFVFDDFLAEPDAYRANALKGEFRSYDFPGCTFHGISIPTPAKVYEKLCREIPGLKPSLSFFRRSPLGQVESHLIHTDIDMGQWSAILYLSPEAPLRDGTDFWTHIATGAVGSEIPHERSEEGKTEEGWELRRHVYGQFNRLAVFPSWLFHSRSIAENWGEGDGARLTQVVFGTGALPG